MASAVPPPTLATVPREAPPAKSGAGNPSRAQASPSKASRRDQPKPKPKAKVGKDEDEGDDSETEKLSLAENGVAEAAFMAAPRARTMRIVTNVFLDKAHLAALAQILPGSEIVPVPPVISREHPVSNVVRAHFVTCALQDHVNSLPQGGVRNVLDINPTGQYVRKFVHLGGYGDAIHVHGLMVARDGHDVARSRLPPTEHYPECECYAELLLGGCRHLADGVYGSVFAVDAYWLSCEDLALFLQNSAHGARAVAYVLLHTHPCLAGRRFEVPGAGPEYTWKRDGQSVTARVRNHGGVNDVYTHDLRGMVAGWLGGAGLCDVRGGYLVSARIAAADGYALYRVRYHAGKMRIEAPPLEFGDALADVTYYGPLASHIFAGGGTAVSFGGTLHVRTAKQRVVVIHKAIVHGVCAEFAGRERSGETWRAIQGKVAAEVRATREIPAEHKADAVLAMTYVAFTWRMPEVATLMNVLERETRDDREMLGEAVRMRATPNIIVDVLSEVFPSFRHFVVDPFRRARIADAFSLRYVPVVGEIPFFLNTLFETLPAARTTKDVPEPKASFSFEKQPLPGYEVPEPRMRLTAFARSVQNVVTSSDRSLGALLESINHRVAPFVGIPLACADLVADHLVNMGTAPGQFFVPKGGWMSENEYIISRARSKRDSVKRGFDRLRFMASGAVSYFVQQRQSFVKLEARKEDQPYAEGKAARHIMASREPAVAALGPHIATIQALVKEQFPLNHSVSFASGCNTIELGARMYEFVSFMQEGVVLNSDGAAHDLHMSDPLQAAVHRFYRRVGLPDKQAKYLVAALTKRCTARIDDEIVEYMVDNIMGSGQVDTTITNSIAMILVITASVADVVNSVLKPKLKWTAEEVVTTGLVNLMVGGDDGATAVRYRTWSAVDERQRGQLADVDWAVALTAAGRRYGLDMEYGRAETAGKLEFYSGMCYQASTSDGRTVQVYGPWPGRAIFRFGASTSEYANPRHEKHATYVHDAALAGMHRGHFVPVLREYLKGVLLDNPRQSPDTPSLYTEEAHKPLALTSADGGRLLAVSERDLSVNFDRVLERYSGVVSERDIIDLLDFLSGRQGTGAYKSPFAISHNTLTAMIGHDNGNLGLGTH